jgi:DNA-binding response OmpR family regulator
MRVIFAVDEPSATTMRAVLEELGHDAVGCAGGEQAWEAYRADPASLVALDLKLPDVGALELCHRIRADDAGATTFVLIVTAHDDPPALKAVLDAGADDYVSKPCTSASLRARIGIAARRLHQTAALRAAEADLARARWLAGIGETALALEREIGGPLETILEKSARLLDDPSFTAEQREHLRIILEQGTRLAGVVGRAVNLTSPTTVEYLAGARMIDLSGGHGTTDPGRRRRMLHGETEHAANEDDGSR